MNARSHFNSLQSSIDEDINILGKNIPALPIPSLMPRSDKAPIEEGEKFSGNIRIGEAAVSLTLAASPHFPPERRFEELIPDARVAFDKNPELLVDISNEQLIAPHMIVWWQSADQGSSKTDIFDLSSMSQKNRKDYLEGISQQVIRGFTSLSNFQGKPVIYGSWGYGEPGERNKLGLGRGAPTMPFGHLHIAKANPSNKDVIFPDDLSQSDIIKYRQPWNRHLNKELSHEIEDIIRLAVSDTTRTKTIGFYDNIKSYEGHHSSREQGYKVTYDEFVPLEKALDDCIKVARQTEGVYQILALLHRSYHTHTGNPTLQKQCISEGLLNGVGMGLSENSISKMIDFTIRIPPTTGQLEQWVGDLVMEDDELPKSSLLHKIEQRELTKHLWSKDTDSIMGLLKIDTFTSPDGTGPRLTWPMHSSAIYYIDSVVFKEGKTWTDGFHIFPAFISESGAPENVYGALLTRDIGTASS